MVPFYASFNDNTVVTSAPLRDCAYAHKGMGVRAQGDGGLRAGGCGGLGVCAQGDVGVLAWGSARGANI